MNISAPFLEPLPAIAAFDPTLIIAHFRELSATDRADEMHDVASQGRRGAIELVYQPIQGIVARHGDDLPFALKVHKELRADLEYADIRLITIGEGNRRAIHVPAVF